MNNYFVKFIFCISLISVASVVNAGVEDLVGKKVVNDMIIEFYMESPKMDMVMTSGMPMKMKMKPTHHPELKVFDVESGKFIPYLDVKVQFINQATGKMLNIPLPAMLGGFFHYGQNATLPGKNKYLITINVVPQELMRYKRMATKWAAPFEVSFEYDWK